MENDCKGSIEDVQYLQDVTEYWSVDAHGEPECLQDSSTDGDFLHYQCFICDAEFDEFDDIKRHLGIAEEVAA